MTNPSEDEAQWQRAATGRKGKNYFRMGKSPTRLMVKIGPAVGFWLTALLRAAHGSNGIEDQSADLTRLALALNRRCGLPCAYAARL